MSTQQKALFLKEKRGTFYVGTKDIPEPAAGEVLVEVHATAINPIDWKVQASYDTLPAEYPAVIGHDAAGIVKKVGEGVTNVAVGDRVFYPGYFNNRQGAFQQYSIAVADLIAKVPANVTLDEAATIAVSVGTAAMGLYNKPTVKPFGGLGLTPPWEGGRGKYAGQPFLVIAGASSVGQHAIQLAKVSGFSTIITTASKHNEAFLKSIGATHVIDRNLALKDAIQSVTSEPIKFIFDAVSTRETQNAAYDVLAPGGRIAVDTAPSIEEAKRTQDKEIIHVLGVVHDASQKPVGKELFKALGALVESGDVKPNRVELLPNGLAGLPDGLARLRANKVSAVKLVARPQETA